MDEFSELELRTKFERGDFHDPSQISLAKRLLRDFDKQRAFETRCQNAAKADALFAHRRATIANAIAILALIIAIANTVLVVITLLHK